MDMYLLKFPYRKILQPIAARLSWLNPDILSYTAVVIAAVTGWCFYKAADSSVLLIVAILLTFLRMTLNTLDGVIAIRRGNLSLRGEVVNALPDRYSDIFVVAGIALSPLCRTWLGMAALATMFLVSYTGMLGKALNVQWQHHGPMGKVERLSIVMIAALVQFFVLPHHQTVHWIGITATPMEWSMAVMVVLGQYTVLRRLRGQLREIRQKEALERLAPNRNEQCVLVLYDSMTGNTRQVAEQIACGLGCTAKHLSDAGSIEGYNLVVLGSPNIRKHPTAAVQKFQESAGARPHSLAVFATYGLPVWGQISAPMCLRRMAAAWKMKPIARFSCPGFHRKYGTYRRRPNEQDLLSAFLFGLKLSEKLKRLELCLK